MATTQPQDDFQKTALRLPRDLHEKVVSAANASGRSMNAEIIARLQASFSPSENALPPHLRLDVEAWAERRGLNFVAALERVIQSGLHRNAPEVWVFYPTPGMSSADYAKMFGEAKRLANPDAAVIVDTQVAPARTRKPG
jgi:hypothetical protein